MERREGDEGKEGGGEGGEGERGRGGGLVVPEKLLGAHIEI